MLGNETMNHALPQAGVTAELRTIRADDIEELNALYRSYSGRDIAATRVREAIADYPSVAATRSGEIVGFCYCFRFAPDIIELANIFVSKQYRSGRLGSAMLTHLLQEIGEPIRGVIAVNSSLNEIREQKASPDSFYLRNGFSIIASTENSTIYWWKRPESVAG